MLELTIGLVLLYIFIGSIFGLAYVDGLSQEETAAIVFGWGVLLPIAIIVSVAFGMVKVLQGCCMLVGRAIGAIGG